MNPLRVDLFPHADDECEGWYPKEEEHKWTFTDFANFITPPCDVRRVIADDVYRHLAFWEDLDALYDGRCMVELDTLMAVEFNKAPPLWQTMMESAIKEKQVWEDDGYSCYVRPSLWFLRADWMNDHFNDFVVDKIPSLAFRDNESENRLIYLKNATVKKLAKLIQDNEIDDEDIPHDKYAEVYAEVRQK